MHNSKCIYLSKAKSNTKNIHMISTTNMACREILKLTMRSKGLCRSFRFCEIRFPHINGTSAFPRLTIWLQLGELRILQQKVLLIWAMYLHINACFYRYNHCMYGCIMGAGWKGSQGTNVKIEKRMTYTKY
jgi:hypothetical protein